MKDKMKILLAGCGQIGQQLGTQLHQQGHHVIGVKRHATPTLFPLRLLDLGNSKALSDETPDYDVIVFTVTPQNREESAYRHVFETVLQRVIDFAKRHQQPPLLLLVSSTGVYGQQQGQWVNESSPTQPTHFSGKWLLSAEQNLKKQWQNHLIVRFSGIYGSHRRWLINQAVSGKPIQKSPSLWTNRIHEADCVGSLNFLINAYQKQLLLSRLYLISDDLPVGRYEVCAFICQFLQQAAPDVLTTDLTENLNKRCDNSLIKSMGYSFIYPTFKSGYQAILTQL